jgi:penicillin-binding protein 2
MRVKFVNIALIIVFLSLGLSLFNFQLIHGKKFKTLSDKNCIKLLPQEGSRGRILDRRGNVIVDNYLSYDLMILPQGESTVDESLMKVSQILGANYEDLKKEFKKGPNVPFIPVTIKRNLDIKKALALEELKPDITGLIIQARPQRSYPYGELACHVVGHLSEIDRWRLTKLADYGYKTKDIVGFGGVEEKYDYYLRQEEGGLSVEVDHRGRLVRLVGFKPPKSGKDIQLTLDLRIQKIAEDALADRKGSVIIMDPNNGEILALASSPNFNPSVFINRDYSSISSLFRNPRAPLINRAISSSYPAGSVFKLVVAAAALETGKIDPHTTFFCSGTLNIGRAEFSCWNTHSQQNLKNAITHSCNIFFYRTGLLVGANSIHDYALKFGLSKPTLIDLPYETSGFVPSPLLQKIYKFRNWYNGDTANFSIGQGDLLVTPLQIARLMAVFANKGILVTPYLIKSVDNQDVASYKKPVTRIPIKESTINIIREGLRNVIADPNGTASILGNLAVPVAGKSGTAQVSRGQPHGWFVGFFPFSSPQFVLCVFLENGGAGVNASILAKQIIEAMFREDLIGQN